MAGVTTASARVLICDDKADIRNLVATRLCLEQTFEVVGEAANGAEAIARVSELKPDVMILDLQMPVMSGEEVIPIVRSLAPELRVLVFSAYGGQVQLRGSESPDIEVRKGSGLQPLVKALYELVESTPRDVVPVNLGEIAVDCAVSASHAWARLNPGVRQTAVERGTAPDFLALVGVFLALGEPLQQAARLGVPVHNFGIATRLEAGRAARRALAAIPAVEAEPLEPIRERLLKGLP